MIQTKKLKLSIQTKFILSILVVSLIVITISVIGLQLQKKYLYDELQKKISIRTDQNENLFSSFVQTNTHMMSLALDVYSLDESYKKIFISEDREVLYNYSLPLFYKLNANYGVTYFSYIKPDGTLFLRVHKKEEYGDAIIRESFLRAQSTMSTQSGFDAGKTAFVLRTVAPYYQGENLIGFVEFGEDIAHILETIHHDAGNDFVILIEKSFLDRKEWKSMREFNGLLDNWDELGQYVVVGTTLENHIKVKECISEEDLTAMKNNLLKFKQMTYNNEIYSCNGFQLKNIEGDEIGVVVNYIDITQDMNLFTRIEYFTYILIGLLALLSILIGSIILRMISEPIMQIIHTTKEIEKGNLAVRTCIETGDELEELGQSINSMTEKLQHIQEEREKIDNAKNNFVCMTSHELRSPLTPMKAQLQMLEKNYFGKLKKTQHESVKMVIRNINRLDKIIQDILEISRIDTETLKFTYTLMSLKNETEELVEDMKSYIPEKSIRFKVEMNNLPVFEADPMRITQVLRNLLTNAVKFSKNRGIITIGAEIIQNHILVSVKDNGIGIPEEAGKKLFQPFFQAEPAMSRKFGGIGLGLTISKGIIEAQGGNIWFESSSDKGTAFFFTIPLKPKKEQKSIKSLFE